MNTMVKIKEKFLHIYFKIEFNPHIQEREAA